MSVRGMPAFSRAGIERAWDHVGLAPRAAHRCPRPGIVATTITIPSASFASSRTTPTMKGAESPRRTATSRPTATLFVAELRRRSLTPSMDSSTTSQGSTVIVGMGDMPAWVLPAAAMTLCVRSVTRKRNAQPSWIGREMRCVAVAGKRMDDNYRLAFKTLGLVGRADQHTGQIRQASGYRTGLLDMRSNDGDLLRLPSSSEPVQRQLDYARELSLRAPGSIVTIIVFTSATAGLGWRRENVHVVPVPSGRLRGAAG